MGFKYFSDVTVDNYHSRPARNVDPNNRSFPRYAGAHMSWENNVQINTSHKAFYDGYYVVSQNKKSLRLYRR